LSQLVLERIFPSCLKREFKGGIDFAKAIGDLRGPPEERGINAGVVYTPLGGTTPFWKEGGV